MQSSDKLGATLFDSLQTSMLALAEIGGNLLLTLDQSTLEGCAEMQGHCIAIDITDLDLQLYCHPGSWGLRLSRNPPTREVDATISGRLMALVNLASEQDKLSTSIRERVSFHGNVHWHRKCRPCSLASTLTGKKHSHNALVMCSRFRFINALASLANGCTLAPIPFCKLIANICAKKLDSARHKLSSINSDQE